jgi:hypothetical protein
MMEWIKIRCEDLCNSKTKKDEMTDEAVGKLDTITSEISKHVL